VKQCLALDKRPQLFKTLIGEAKPLTNTIQLEKDDNAIILYTSGTTGLPKGAMLSHENVFSNARDIGTYLQMTADDRVIATLPIFHVFALTVVVNAPLYRGATILLEPQFS